LRDPVTQWIQSSSISDAFRFSSIGLGRLTTALFVCGALAACFAIAEKIFAVDLLLRLVGDRSEAADMQGFSSFRALVGAAAVSGGLCGLAGWVELAGNQFRLIADLSPGYGYYAIVVSVLARNRLTVVPLWALFYSALLNGLDSAGRGLGVPSYVSDVVLGGTFVVHLAIERFRLQSLVWIKYAR
jgi:simple sugar transport system permease protein